MRLAAWSTHPIHLPYPRVIHWASSQESGADYLLLRLDTDDGLTGVAEAQVKSARNGVDLNGLADIVEKSFIPSVHEIDLLDEDAVNLALSQVQGSNPARALVEAACWDLRSQARREPLWRML